MITILKFQEIYSALNIEPDNEIRTAYNVMSVITGVSVDEYRQMKWKDFEKAQKEVTIPSINEMPDEWVKEFEVNGERFYVNQFVTDWNTEQFISMTTLTKERDSIILNLHLILATLCYKEKGELVSQTEFDRRASLFQEHLDVMTAYPIGFFFALTLAELSQTTQYSLMLKKTKMKLLWMSLKNHLGLLKNGDGITR